MKIIKNYLIFGITAIILGIAALAVFPYLLTWGLGQLNPMQLQRQAISKFNKSQDAFSSIDGTEVAKVPLNGIENLFSKKSSDEIDISIPKILNTSTLFNTNNEKENGILENAWINSIDQEQLTRRNKKLQSFLQRFEGIRVQR